MPCPSFSVPGFSQVFVLNSGDSERHLGDDVFILGKNRKRVDASSDPWGGGGARARVDITTQQKRTHTTDDDTHARLNPAERGLRRLSACRLGPKSNQKRHVTLECTSEEEGLKEHNMYYTLNGHPLAAEINTALLAGRPRNTANRQPSVRLPRGKSSWAEVHDPS